MNLDEFRERAFRWFSMGFHAGFATIAGGRPKDIGMDFAQYWDDEKAMEMLKDD